MELVAASKIDSSSLILLAGVIIVVTMIVISTRRRAADRGASPRAYAREQLARLREQGGLRDDMEQLMLQLEELAREINAQVDTKFAKLERAIADADARLAEFERLGLGQPNPGPDAPESGSPDARDEAAEPDADDAEPDAPDVTPDESGQGDALQQRVLELAEAGQTPIDIARQVGRDVGEVELIIKLHRRDPS